MKLSKGELRYCRSLSQKKVRQAERKFILEGWRALKEVLNSSTKMEMVAVHPRFLQDPDYSRLLSELESRGIPVKEADELQLQQIAETVHAQGVIAVVQQKHDDLERIPLDRASVIVAVDAVSDPGNLGSIIRSSDWFNVDALLLGRGCVELYNEKLVRSTVGSIFHIAIVEGVELPSVLQHLGSKGFSVAGFSGDGKVDYMERQMSRKAVFVFGSEAHGISREVKASVDQIVRIPRYGKAESLNVGVACGIVLAHERAQREQQKGT
ncbi:MAG TPA: 23S rRNA (guanosine(2251)-2'-O)-methyltransferase RlmB [Bacteroidetes bacterium]|nr:23S rRNA (guanosine(2251)-2'-O)-methyltransferase RlmB [Bacteroidota bacterium]